ncbi:MauE/DoxX family redox-associated membrane protein [Mucilaginibacter defluvii]|uniref:Methylamine utilisation protein MauE domain-containing protein n=1 Tax=Mucilaginibacter defluvii TaxID=1196019 RepID=A0ABP9FN37_9SPHI|nr:hypothetical protein [Bacteroidota bacterium]
MKREQWLLEIICGLTALLFIYTAASKLLEYEQFRQEIFNQAFNPVLFPVIIYGLPPAELFVAVMLLVPKLRLAGLYLSTLLMILFTGYVGLVTFHFYDRVPCSCAGVFKHMSWPVHLAFNLVFTVATIYGIKIFNAQRIREKLKT